jgi:multidrug resistance efflux pump
VADHRTQVEGVLVNADAERQFDRRRLSLPVSGYLVQRNCRDGAPVHKGNVLFEIDARPLNAILVR